MMTTQVQAGTPELHVDGAVATLTLRRPQQANRLEPDDLLAISEHVARVNATPAVLVLRVQATGKTFCAGYDIGQIGGSRTPINPPALSTIGPTSHSRQWSPYSTLLPRCAITRTIFIRVMRRKPS
jgi:enoyl-CoA hydratase/carnithine racemase